MSPRLDDYELSNRSMKVTGMQQDNGEVCRALKFMYTEIRARCSIRGKSFRGG